ncbi:MAG: phycocyanin subunit beta, partial [Cyanobacteria bacterium J06636_28]
MYDAFTKVISQADARGEYIGDAQISALSQLVAEGSKRMDVVNRLTGSANAIITNAARAL